jgi:hypothetical protein
MAGDGKSLFPVIEEVNRVWMEDGRRCDVAAKSDDVVVGNSRHEHRPTDDSQNYL